MRLARVENIHPEFELILAVLEPGSSTAVGAGSGRRWSARLAGRVEGMGADNPFFYLALAPRIAAKEQACAFEA